MQSESEIEKNWRCVFCGIWVAESGCLKWMEIFCVCEVAEKANESLLKRRTFGDGDRDCVLCPCLLDLDSCLYACREMEICLLSGFGGEVVNEMMLVTFGDAEEVSARAT
jgi:hypothetical protein